MKKIGPKAEEYYKYAYQLRTNEETEPSTLGYLPKYKNIAFRDLDNERIYRVGIAIVLYYKWGLTQEELKKKKDRYDAIIRIITKIQTQLDPETVKEAIKRGLAVRGLLIKANPLVNKLEENDIKVEPMS